MFISQGYTINSNNFWKFNFRSQGAKCYSADVVVYDILCDTWYNVQSGLPQDLSADLPRFGHSAVMLNGTMLIYGGFHGNFEISQYLKGSNFLIVSVVE